MPKQLLPRVTADTIRAVDEVMRDSPGACTRMLEQLGEENPLLAHQIVGWVNSMVRGHGENEEYALLAGPMAVYQLLKAQAESDSIKLG